MEEIIKVKAAVLKKLFYNQDSMYGGFSFYPIQSSSDIKLHQRYKNFVVTGNCPMLIEGNIYEFTMKPTWSKKYGDGYQFVEIKQPALDTVEAQQQFLREIISEKDANTLISAYPNVKIIDYIKEDKIDINKLNGIKEKKYQKIKEKIKEFESIQIALVELRDLGITTKSIQKLVKHFGSQDVLIQKIRENIYSLCEVDQFGFKKVDEYAMKRGDDPYSPNRIKACFEYIIKEYANNGHSWISTKELAKKTNELINIDVNHIINIFNQLKEDPGKFYIQDEKISLKKYYQYELEIKKHLDRLMSTYEGAKNTIPVEKIEKSLGITFTKEQKEAIQMSQKSGVFILNGRAGTGKTTTIKGIVENQNYAACALSGKAAKVLESKGINAFTIHRLLKVDHEGKFIHNEQSPLPYDLIILDEASMVNSQLFYYLIRAIPDGGRFVIVGDNGQLPPIGMGAVFDDLLSINVYPRKELTKIHRQAEKSGILSSANLIRDGIQINKQNDYSKKIYGELKDMTLIPTSDKNKIFEYTIQIAKNYYQKFKDTIYSDFQIITPLKKRGENSVKNLNIELQKIFNDLNKKYIAHGGYEYREGDKIIHNGNNYNAIVIEDLKVYEKHGFDNLEELYEKGLVKIRSVFNGTLGKIIHINTNKNEMLIEFEDIDGFVLYTKEELNMIELAYAITVHRSQGMGIKNVLFVFDYTAYKLLSKQMVYTGITRASERLVLLCENGALHKAISTDLGNSRNTFLKDLLKGEHQ